MDIKPSEQSNLPTTQLSSDLQTSHPSQEREPIGTTGLATYAVASVRNQESSQQISTRLPPSSNEEKPPTTIDGCSGISHVIHGSSPQILIGAQRIDMINSEMLNISREICELEIEIECLSGEEQVKFRRKKTDLVSLYSTLFEKKLAVAKNTFSNPIEAILALAVPTTIPADERFCTAGSLDKIRSLLENGIVFDDSKPATGPVDGANFSDNELGNRGVYFNRGTEPTYASDDLPLGLKCSTLRLTSGEAIEGCAIRPTSELEIICGFSKEHINAAFNVLQRKYAFIQNDGLPPKDTEVVFMRNSDILRLDYIWMNGDISLEEAIAYEMIDKDQLYKIKQAWTTQ